MCFSSLVHICRYHEQLKSGYIYFAARFKRHNQGGVPHLWQHSFLYKHTYTTGCGGHSIASDLWHFDWTPQFLQSEQEDKGSWSEEKDNSVGKIKGNLPQISLNPPLSPRRVARDRPQPQNLCSHILVVGRWVGGGGSALGRLGQVVKIAADHLPDMSQPIQNLPRGL